VLEIDLAPFGIADQLADALALPAEALQQLSVLRSVVGLELHADALRQRGAMPSG
jgi:hypothetical protein